MKRNLNVFLKSFSDIVFFQHASRENTVLQVLKRISYLRKIITYGSFIPEEKKEGKERLFIDLKLKSLKY